MTAFDLTSPVVRELRAARPRAPEALRERVFASASAEGRAPVWSRVPRFSARRTALVLVPACVVAGVGFALVHGIVNSGGSGSQSAARGHGTVVRHAAAQLQMSKAHPTTTVPTAAPPGVVQAVEQLPRIRALGKSDAPAPSPHRLQDYRAALTIRVDGLDALSPATQKAMRTARRLGGYVVSAHYGASKQGSSELVFRIPITQIQRAISSFSALGTIAAQDIQITDLQAQFNRLAAQIDSLRVQIAKVDDRLADPSLSNADRVLLQQRRARLVRTLDALTTQKTATVKRARLATVSLNLTTLKAAVVTKPHHSGPVGRALDDAGTILAKEVSWLLYALVVLGPLAVLGVLALVAVRFGRRHADRRLLESS
jgi:hypothetical protein